MRYIQIKMRTCLAKFFCIILILGAIFYLNLNCMFLVNLPKNIQINIKSQRFHNIFQPCPTASFPLLHTLFSTVVRARPLLCTSLSLNQIASTSVLRHSHSRVYEQELRVNTSQRRMSSTLDADFFVSFPFTLPIEIFRKNIQT